jgi:hypothetical protein
LLGFNGAFVLSACFYFYHFNLVPLLLSSLRKAKVNKKGVKAIKIGAINIIS